MDYGFKIKECPFCGGEALIDKWSMSPFEVANIPDNDGHWYVVFCNECTSEGAHCITKEDAVNVWNKRVNEN